MQIFYTMIIAFPSASNKISAAKMLPAVYAVSTSWRFVGSAQIPAGQGSVTMSSGQKRRVSRGYLHAGDAEWNKIRRQVIHVNALFKVMLTCCAYWAPACQSMRRCCCPICARYPTTAIQLSWTVDSSGYIRLYYLVSAADQFSGGHEAHSGHQVPLAIVWSSDFYFCVLGKKYRGVSRSSRRRICMWVSRCLSGLWDGFKLPLLQIPQLHRIWIIVITSFWQLNQVHISI